MPKQSTFLTAECAGVVCVHLTVHTCMPLIAIIAGRRGQNVKEIEEQSKASIKVGTIALSQTRILCVKL